MSASLISPPCPRKFTVAYAVVPSGLIRDAPPGAYGLATDAMPGAAATCSSMPLMRVFTAASRTLPSAVRQTIVSDSPAAFGATDFSRSCACDDSVPGSWNESL